MSDEVVESKRPIQMTELLLRTPVGKSFYIEVETSQEAAQVQRALHSRVAMLKSHSVKIKVRSVRAIRDADPDVPGDTDKVVRLVEGVVRERTAI